MPYQVGHDILQKEYARSIVGHDILQKEHARSMVGHDKSTNFPSFSQNASVQAAPKFLSLAV